MKSPSGNDITSVKFHLYLYDDNQWILKVDEAPRSLPSALTHSNRGHGITNLIDQLIVLREKVRDYESGEEAKRELLMKIKKAEAEVAQLKRKLADIATRR